MIDLTRLNKVINICKELKDVLPKLKDDVPQEEAEAYRKLVLECASKQNPISVLTHGKYGFMCPCCKTPFALEREDIFVYDMKPPKYCEHCGQKVDWSKV